jgi:hypothetical protein
MCTVSINPKHPVDNLPPNPFKVAAKVPGTSLGSKLESNQKGFIGL